MGTSQLPNHVGESSVSTSPASQTGCRHPSHAKVIDPRTTLTTPMAFTKVKLWRMRQDYYVMHTFPDLFKC
jgi:hypothetical protein